METTLPSPTPLVRSNNTGIAVLPMGLATTAAALLGVWYVGRGDDGTNIMGWYLDFVIPAGALLVGIVAGSGYGLGSWWTGLRISRSVLLWVLLLQFLAYWVAQYLAFEVQHLVYRSTGRPLSFFDYYHLVTISMIWKSHDASSAGSDSAGTPLGMWAYALRVMEIVGFVGGALIILVALRAKPYCETCRVYMNSRKLPTLPASVKARKVKKSDLPGQQAYAAEQKAAADGGASLLSQIAAATTASDVDTFNHIINAARPTSKQAEKLPRRITMRLFYCKKCFSGHLSPAVVTGRGKKMKATKLDRVTAPDTFVRGAVGATARP
jgi:hypothetical protein